MVQFTSMSKDRTLRRDTSKVGCFLAWRWKEFIHKHIKTKTSEMRAENISFIVKNDSALQGQVRDNFLGRAA
jgi:hypothetical protein